MNRRIADIELLRGIAILFVLFEHTRFNLFGQPGPWLDYAYQYFGGWTGVDLFFAISGFVIARDLVPKLNHPDAARFPALMGFWLRRATRLWPSAWLWLGLILLANLFFNQSGAFGQLSDNLAATMAGIFNYANYRLIHTFGHTPYGASFPYWSLSLEEQFYLLLPLFILLFRRWLPYALLIPLLFQLVSNRHINIYFMQFRSDAIILGVLLSMWATHASYSQLEPVFFKNRRWLQWIILPTLMCLLGTIGSYRFQEWRFWIGSVALISATLVWLASYDKDYLMPDIPLKRIFLWLGSRSYALYLTHIPAYFASREIWCRIAPQGTIFDHTYNTRMGLTAFCLLLIFAELNYRFIEIPFRSMGKKWAERIKSRHEITI